MAKNNHNTFFRKNAAFFIIVGIFAILEIFLFLHYGNGRAYVSSLFHKTNSSVPSGIILFYGNNCPDCTKVDDFIKSNSAVAKIPITQLEVFNNVSNANILSDKAQVCGLDYSQIGVPFLWDGKNCYIGYVDVIKFFQSKVNAKTPKT